MPHWRDRWWANGLDAEGFDSCTLVWEYWRIPFRNVSVDVPKVTVDLLRKELQTDIGFHADSCTYGRQLLANKKPEKALAIFQLNFKKMATPGPPMWA